MLPLVFISADFYYMPHQRPRHLTNLLRDTLKFSPIVGILGHRQVGKTTLASILSSNYFTLDLKHTREKIKNDPTGFIESNFGSPLAIDECQLCPDLFPSLKDFVRKNKKPGQFLLTGSVRFTSRKAIKESLTGRIINWELLPMDYCELKQLPLADMSIRFLESKNVELEIKTKSFARSIEVKRYLASGGLPGVFSIRNDAIRTQKFESQLEAILDRDLRLILETTLSLRTLLSLLTFLADKQGTPLNLAEVSRATRISTPTLRKLLTAFEALFLIRIYPTEGGEKAPIIYFEDQGEASHLAHGQRSELQEIEHYLFANLRTQWAYRPQLKIVLRQYRTRSGAIVPFVLRNAKGVLGIIPCLEENPTLSALGSAHSFLRDNPKAKVLYVHLGSRDKIINTQERALPMGAIIT